MAGTSPAMTTLVMGERVRENLASKDGYTISTDPSRIDLACVHRWLSEESYWAKGIPLETVKRAAENSLCFGVYDLKGKQVGFARVVTDYATFGYLADVFIDTAERGMGLSKFLMRAILDHPKLQGFRRMLLATRDAHMLYEQFGFHAPRNPQNLMERHDPEVYTRPTAEAKERS
jgi:GNAT superfamily N-acetyltransferase